MRHSGRYERVVDAKYLEEIRSIAKQVSTKLVSRGSGVSECAIRHFKNGKNVIKPRTLRKLTKAIHHLQNKKTRNVVTPMLMVMSIIDSMTMSAPTPK